MAKLGNNKNHDPTICENCEENTCYVCSNGPREFDYKWAEAEAELIDNIPGDDI